MDWDRRSKHRCAKLTAFAGSIIYEPGPMAPNESGALPISGTEVPIPLTTPGFSLHDELQTMADVGMSAYYETILPNAKIAYPIMVILLLTPVVMVCHPKGAAVKSQPGFK